ncbi:MAG: glycosyltransferase family 4 protein [Acidobacteriota bacterium]
MNLPFGAQVRDLSRPEGSHLDTWIGRRFRMAIVASHVIQYQDPFYRSLAGQHDLDLEVLYCSDQGAKVYRDADMGTSLRWDLDLLHGYAYRFLPNLGRGEGFWRLFNPSLVGALGRGSYDAVLFMTGWAWASAWIGFASARFFRIPILIFGDSSFVPPEGSPKSFFRAGVLRALFAMISGFMVSGVFNARYYRHYKVDPRRFFPMPWAIDNARFLAASSLQSDERRALLARYGISPGRMVILFSAKFIERKDPMTLLAAYAAMKYRDRAAVVFMGDGILRAQLEAFSREHHLTDVHFTGFVNQSEIPRHYAMSDVFVLPSAFDPRATVINEAMACGLPVILTDRCGPVGDIAREGDNAFVFNFGDRATLTDRLDRLAADPELRIRMGKRSREIIANWDYDAGTRGVMNALRYVTEKPA